MSDLPTSAHGTLSLLATTQTQIDVFSDTLIAEVKNGEVNPIQVLIMLKAFEKMSDRVYKEIRENVLTEAAKYSGRVFEMNGNLIEKAEVGVSYKYETSNDPIYFRRLDIAKQANEQLKERETFLKALKEPMKIVDEETGELIEIRPPVRQSTSSVKVSIR